MRAVIDYPFRCAIPQYDNGISLDPDRLPSAGGPSLPLLLSVYNVEDPSRLFRPRQATSAPIGGTHV
jgi:hypothetical protein